MFNPQFNITNKILKNIGTIEAAKEVIMDAPLLPLWEKEFKEDAIVRSVHHGTHIEGNKLDLSEAKDVLLGKDVIGRSRDIQEVINYRKVLKFIEDEALKDVERITEDLVKKLHKIVMEKILPDEEVGKYRMKQVVIKNSENGEITFRPPPAIEIPFLIREFLYWVNKTTDEDVHPVLKAAIVHHETVRIHPFIDGNGRVSRAFATLILSLGKYDIRRFFSLEEFYDKDALAYYEHLQKASSGDMTAWLEYFSFGVSVEFERIKNRILKMSKDNSLKQKLGGKQLFLTERQAKIVEYIQNVGYLQNQQFKELFPTVSEDTVLRDIKELVNNNLIKKVGSTKSARYIMV